MIFYSVCALGWWTRKKKYAGISKNNAPAKYAVDDPYLKYNIPASKGPIARAIEPDERNTPRWNPWSCSLEYNDVSDVNVGLIKATPIDIKNNAK